MLTRRIFGAASCLRPTFSIAPFLNSNSSAFEISQQLRFKKYSASVEDRFKAARKSDPNVGSLDKQRPDVGVGIVGSGACGDMTRLSVVIDEKTETITDVKYKTFGCASAIAASSLVAEQLKGKTIEEAERITNRAIATELSLPPVKLHCSLLAEDAVKAAVKDWRNKRKNRVSTFPQASSTPQAASDVSVKQQLQGVSVHTTDERAEA